MNANFLGDAAPAEKTVVVRQLQAGEALDYLVGKVVLPRMHEGDLHVAVTPSEFSDDPSDFVFTPSRTIEVGKFLLKQYGVMFQESPDGMVASMGSARVLVGEETENSAQSHILAGLKSIVIANLGETVCVPDIVEVQRVEPVQSKPALSADELRSLAQDINEVAQGNAYSERVLRTVLEIVQAQPDSGYVRSGVQALKQAIEGKEYSYFALQDVSGGLVRLAEGKDYTPVIHPWQSYGKAQRGDGTIFDVYVCRDDDAPTGMAFNAVNEGMQISEDAPAFFDLKVLLAFNGAVLLPATVGTISFIPVDHSRLSDADMNECGMLGNECVRLHDASGKVVEAFEVDRDEQRHSLTICNHYAIGPIDESAHKKLLCKLNEKYDLSCDPALHQTANMLREMAGLSSAQDLGQMVVRRGTLKLEREMVVTADVGNDGPSCGM